MNTKPDNAADSPDKNPVSAVEIPAKAVSEASEAEKRRDEVFADGGKPRRSKPKPAKTKPEKTKREKRPVGLFTVCLAALIAAGLGAAGGGALSRVLDNDSPSVEPSQMTQRLDALEADVLAAKAQIQAPAAQMDMSQIDALSARIAALESLPLGGGEDGMTASDLAVLSARLDALDKSVAELTPESSNPPEPNPRLLALEETVSRLSDAPAIDPAIEQRIQALENAPAEETQSVDMEPLTSRISALEAVSLNAAEPVDIAPLSARLDALEAKVASASAARAALPVPDFPKDAVLTAILEAENASKGWAGRILGKHVRTRDEAVVTSVDEIAILVSEGQIETALSRIEQLPEAGQRAAKTWTDIVSVQRTLP